MKVNILMDKPWALFNGKAMVLSMTSIPIDEGYACQSLLSVKPITIKAVVNILNKKYNLSIFNDLR